MIKKGIYRHYKGKDYEVIDVCIHSETDEPLVLYKPLYDCPGLASKGYDIRPLFVRPIDLFTETIDLDGKEILRFSYIRTV